MFWRFFEQNDLLCGTTKHIWQPFCFYRISSYAFKKLLMPPKVPTKTLEKHFDDEKYWDGRVFYGTTVHVRMNRTVLRSKPCYSHNRLNDIGVLNEQIQTLVVVECFSALIENSSIRSCQIIRLSNVRAQLIPGYLSLIHSSQLAMVLVCCFPSR